MSRNSGERAAESNPEEEYDEKYAIFVPEGAGFLHCRYLGLGGEGSAHVVRSIVDNQDYTQTDGIRNPEVALYRPHSHIPRLLGSGDYSVLAKNHPRHAEFQSSFMIFSLSNGGTLSRLFQILERERILAPEALVLQIFDHLLGAIIFLHNGAPGLCGIAHRDAHGENVFVHFPIEETKLPEIMLGDLGAARAISDSVWEDSGVAGTRRLKAWTTFEKEIEAYEAVKKAGAGTNGQDPALHRAQAQEMYWDLKSLQILIIRAFEGRGQETNRPLVGTPVCAETEKAVTQFQEAIAAYDYNAAVAVYPDIHDLAEQFRARTNLCPEFQWTRQDRYRDDLPPGQPSVLRFPWTRYNAHLNTNPEALAALQQPLRREGQYAGTKPQIKLFSSRLDLLSSTLEVPGPWQIARICAKTLKVMAVEYFTYAFHVPTVEDRWEDGQIPNPLSFDFDEHRDMQRHFVRYGADAVGLNTVLKQMEMIEGNAGMAEDPHGLLQLDPTWCSEKGGLSKQVRLTLVAEAVATEPRADAALEQGATTPVGSPAHSTGDPPPEPTNTTPPGSPAPSTGNPPAPTTTAAVAGNPAPSAGPLPRRRRQRREYGRPNVETRAMAAATKRNTRSMTKAAIEKAKKRR